MYPNFCFILYFFYFRPKYAITGNESQVITVSLAPGDKARSEPGTMMYMTSGVDSDVSCRGCFGRWCSGEDCCEIEYRNNSGAYGYTAMTPNLGTANKVVPLDLASPNVNGEILCQKGSYMASYGNVEVEVKFDFNFCRCCCAGMGFAVQKIVGSGVVFLCASGTVVQKILGPGEKILIDTNCILAYSATCELDIQKASRGVMGFVGSGEGFFNSSITGPGIVWVSETIQNILIYLGKSSD